MTRLLACTLVVAMGRAFGGPTVYGLREAIRDATEIVVAEMKAVYPAAGVSEQPRGLVPDSVRHPCWLDLAVRDVLKGDLGAGTRTLKVLIQTGYPDCTGPAGTLNPASSPKAIWFLQKMSNDVRRPVVDNAVAARSLQSFTTVTAAVAMGEQATTRAKLAWVLLSPPPVSLVLTTLNERNEASTAYLTRVARELLSLGSWEDFLSAASRRLSQEGSPFRRSLCAALSEYGVCLECGPSQNELARRPTAFASPANLRRFEQEALHRLQAKTLAELRKNFGYVELAELREVLIWYSCMSISRVREQARQNLKRFRIADTEALPCPGCTRLRVEAR